MRPLTYMLLMRVYQYQVAVRSEHKGLILVAERNLLRAAQKANVTPITRHDYRSPTSIKSLFKVVLMATIQVARSLSILESVLFLF